MKTCSWKQRRRSLRIIGGTKKKTGGLGDGSPPAASRGGAPVGSLGDEVPQKLKVFFVKLHIIFALRYNKQQLLSLESTSLLKYWGDITMDVPPFINIGGTCPPCPIGIDAPGWKCCNYVAVLYASVQAVDILDFSRSLWDCVFYCIVKPESRIPNKIVFEKYFFGGTAKIPTIRRLEYCIGNKCQRVVASFWLWHHAIATCGCGFATLRRSKIVAHIILVQAILSRHAITPWIHRVRWNRAHILCACVWKDSNNTRSSTARVNCTMYIAHLQLTQLDQLNCFASTDVLSSICGRVEPLVGCVCVCACACLCPTINWAHSMGQ